MSNMEYHRGQYSISLDKARLDIPLIYQYLSQHAYWAKGRPREIVEKSIEHSLCFGIYKEGRQVGFARVVTDFATFSWLCDVFILDAHRGKGLGKWLVATIVDHPDLQNAKTILLATRDAHQLYAQYGGFVALPLPQKWMVRPQKR